MFLLSGTEFQAPNRPTTQAKGAFSEISRFRASDAPPVCRPSPSEQSGVTPVCRPSRASEAMLPAFPVRRRSRRTPPEQAQRCSPKGYGEAEPPCPSVQGAAQPRQTVTHPASEASQRSGVPRGKARRGVPFDFTPQGQLCRPEDDFRAAELAPRSKNRFLTAFRARKSPQRFQRKPQNQFLYHLSVAFHRSSLFHHPNPSAGNASKRHFRR